MSGICGYVGRADPALLDVMLAAIDYRGDHTDVDHGPGMGLGYRWWGGRAGQSPSIHRDGPHRTACAGTFAPPVPSPAAALRGRLDPRGQGLEDLDGASPAPRGTGVVGAFASSATPSGSARCTTSSTPASSTSPAS